MLNELTYNLVNITLIYSCGKIITSGYDFDMELMVLYAYLDITCIRLCPARTGVHAQITQVKMLYCYLLHILQPGLMVICLCPAHWRWT